MSRVRDTFGLGAAAMSLAAVLGCGGSDSSTPSGGQTTGDTLCVPGEQVACGCSNGRSGAQICESDGARYGACECDKHPTGSSGGGGAGGHGGSPPTGGGSVGGSGGTGGVGASSSSSSSSASSSSSSSSSGAGGSVGPGEAVWAEVFGSSGNADVTSLAVDATGAAIVGGTFFDQIALAGQVYTCAHQIQCGFIAQLETDGTTRWAVPFIGSIYEVHVAAVPGGGAVAVGTFQGATDFGDGPILGDVFAASYDDAGAARWTYHFDGPFHSENLTGVGVNDSGDIVVVGTAYQGIDFGLGLIGAGQFVATLRSDGFPLWNRSLGAGTGGAGSGTPIALTPLGDILIAGEYPAAGDVGCGPLPAGATTFVAKLDASGACMVSKPLGAAYVGALAVDPSDDGFAVTGYLNGGTLDVGSSILTGQGSYDALIVRVDAAGDPIWGYAFGDDQAQFGLGVAVDPTTGDIALAGGVAGSANFGEGSLTSAGGASTMNAFVATFTRVGTPRWSRMYGDSHTSLSNATAYTPSGHLIVGGNISGTMNFGSTFIEAPGQNDGFVVELVQP